MLEKQPGLIDVFRNRIFRDLWLSSLVSNTGGMMQLVGAAWLMTVLSPSQGMVALVQSSVTLPLMLTSVAAGVLADSYDRRRVMLAAQSFMLVVSVVLAIMAFAGMLTPWLLLAFTFLIGTGMAIHFPSWQASYRDLVPPEHLPAAVSAGAMGMNITRAVGPAIGGAIVALAGAATAFALNAVTYVTIIAALLRWRPRTVPSRLPRERFGSALGAGLRYFMMSPHLINVDFRGFLYGFAGISMQALLPLVVRDRLGADAFVFGLLLGAFGAGAVLAAMLAARIRSAFANETICRAAFGCFAITCITVALSGNVILTTAAVFLSGGLWLTVMSLLNVSVQTSTPRWVLGRIISLYMTSIFAGMALGGWVWGMVTEAFGLAAAYFCAAGVLALGALWGFVKPLPQQMQTNLDPLNRFNEPALHLDLTQRSGPILIMVEYDIAQEDVTEFMAAMADRRRIRLRDGARHWALLRDLEHPDRWVESYHLPTWTDYLRHVDRRTVADDEVIERLLALHRGPQPLTVHRMIERPTVHPLDDTPRIDPDPEHPH